MGLRWRRCRTVYMEWLSIPRGILGVIVVVVVSGGMDLHTT